MKSAISEPSRITATAQTTPSAKIDCEPDRTASPTRLTSAASSRPWLAIQTLCQVSIATAMRRIRGVKYFLANLCKGLPDRARKRRDE
jgi:hypothetical protein